MAAEVAQYTYKSQKTLLHCMYVSFAYPVLYVRWEIEGIIAGTAAHGSVHSCGGLASRAGGRRGAGLVR